MYYSFFNSNVSLLTESGNVTYKKSSNEKYYHYEHGNVTYSTVDFKLLPKALRNGKRDVYWVDGGGSSLLLHGYGVTPSVTVVTSSGQRCNKKVNELLQGSDKLLFHDGSRELQLSEYSVSYVSNFSGNTYLSNYVLHVPSNKVVVVNGFFI